MKRIVAYLQGGLGNQCFIYAAARALALRSGSELVLDYDYLADDRIFRRRPALDSFMCPFKVAPPGHRIVRLAKRIRNVVLRNRIRRLGNLCIDRRPYVFAELPADFRGTLVLDGYWQSEKYFVDAWDVLLADFRLKDASWVAGDPIARQIAATPHSTFLHVRSYREVPGREDGSLSVRMVPFYQKAILRLQEMVADVRFFVFGDNVAFAKKLVAPFLDERAVFVEPVADGDGTLRDFTLMRMCRHGIVADSSFSWWAGWLGEQERLERGETALRLHVAREIMNRDFWPERWIAV